MTVRVITDSTADLPPEMAAELGIEVVPLNVHFGTDTFRDGIDLSADEFYERLVASSCPPTTSQPSVGAFLEVYQKALEGADGIVSVHISAKLSGTWNSAIQAREQLADPSRVQVVDTGQASMGLGWVAVAAARAAQAGASLEEVAREAQSTAEQVRVLFLVDTLEFLQKGGRIGKAQAMFGSVLSIKPLLTIQEGEVHPMERVRTRGKGVARLVQLVQEAAPAAVHGGPLHHHGGRGTCAGGASGPLRARRRSDRWALGHRRRHLRRPGPPGRRMGPTGLDQGYSSTVAATAKWSEARLCRVTKSLARRSSETQM